MLDYWLLLGPVGSFMAILKNCPKNSYPQPQKAMKGEWLSLKNNKTTRKKVADAKHAAYLFLSKYLIYIFNFLQLPNVISLNQDYY